MSAGGEVCALQEVALFDVVSFIAIDAAVSHAGLRLAVEEEQGREGRDDDREGPLEVGVDGLNAGLVTECFEDVSAQFGQVDENDKRETPDYVKVASAQFILSLVVVNGWNVGVLVVAVSLEKTKRQEDTDGYTVSHSMLSSWHPIFISNRVISAVLFVDECFSP